MENSTDSRARICDLFENVYFNLIDGSSVPYVLNAAINTPLSVVAAVANVLVFYAIRTTKSLHPPSKLLLGSLVLTDLAVSLFAQPLFVVFLVAKVQRLAAVSCFCLTAYLFGGAMLGCVALTTMTAIGVDRFIAFRYHRRYRDIVTVRRAAAVIAVIWVSSAVFAAMYHVSPQVYGALVFLVMFACVVVTSGAYVKIYRGLRRHRASYRVKGPPRPDGSSGLNVASFRKTASSMLWIYCLFLICYVPYVASIVAQRTLGLSVVLRCIIEYAVTVLFFNSCLNPFVYCYRLNDIRAIVVKTLRKPFGRRFCAAPEQDTPAQSSTADSRTTDTQL